MQDFETFGITAMSAQEMQDVSGGTSIVRIVLEFIQDVTEMILDCFR